MKQKILIIEDDKKLNNGIKLALKNDSYIFFQCRTLADAREVLQNNTVHLVFLDINLPDGNGISFLKEIRCHSQVPVIIITINNMELDSVTGLEAGADDYITKPFSLMVLRARAEVQLRSYRTGQKSIFETSIFYFDFDKMVFLKNGISVDLSKTEQRLLRLLCENKGATLKRSFLIDYVWQGDTEFVDGHALTVTIKRLRDKLEEDSKNPVYIKTVYGIGYTWVVD